MKRSFYPRLAVDGMRKNRRMYGPYLAMGVLMAAICYILSALSRSDALRTLPGGDNLCMIMALGNVVLLIFSVIFLFYTNSFLIRRRRREFGLYNVLGMSKRNLARILTWETLLTAAIVIAGGLFFGVLLSKLIGACHREDDGRHWRRWPSRSTSLPCLGTAGGFAVIYALLGSCRWCVWDEAPPWPSCAARPRVRSRRGPTGFSACWASSCSARRIIWPCRSKTRWTRSHGSLWRWFWSFSRRTC